MASMSTTLTKLPKTNDLSITTVHSPFHKERGITQVRAWRRETIAQLKEAAVPFAFPVIATVNGAIVAEEQWSTFVPKMGDCVVFIPVLEGGGDKGKGILSIFAFIGIMLIAPHLTSMLLPGASTTSAMYLAVQASIMVAGGMLVSSLIGPSPQKLTNSGNDLDNSQTYGWSPVTKQQQGIPIPKFYGLNKVYGNIISAYTAIDPADATLQRLNMAIGLCRGPVKGITKSDGTNYDITINDQPFQYYSDVFIDERLGTNLQTVLAPNSEALEAKAEYCPNRLVTYDNGPITYAVPDSDFSALEISLIFPRGIYAPNPQTGLPKESSVSFKIQIAPYGTEDWSTLVDTSYTANSIQAIRLDFANTGTYTGGGAVSITRGTKYKIKVEKVSTDKGATYGDDMRLDSVRESLGADFTYPLTAVVGITALASDQLSGGLQFNCLLEGAVVDVFDGATWNVEYSTNPAWVVWDALTDPIITGESEGNYAIDSYRGMDPRLDDETPRMNLASFYALSVFCSTLVPDGKGGTEERMTFNGGFDTSMSRWETALKICEVARCALMWNGATLSIVIDQAETPSALFTISNTLKDSFKENFLPRADRASEIEILYRDEAQDFERVPFTVFDGDAGSTSNKISLELFGTTKRSEAWRAAKYRLLQNKLILRTMEFDVSIDALATAVGRVVWVDRKSVV